jgi:hypothetical protein
VAQSQRIVLYVLENVQRKGRVQLLGLQTEHARIRDAKALHTNIAVPAKPIPQRLNALCGDVETQKKRPLEKVPKVIAETAANFEDAFAEKYPELIEQPIIETVDE